MKIGNVELPDKCPKCGMPLLKKPGCRIGSSRLPKWETWSVQCLKPKCKWESETVKLKIDHSANYRELKNRQKQFDNMKDATQYKTYLFGLIKRIKK